MITTTKLYMTRTGFRRFPRFESHYMNCFYCTEYNDNVIPVYGSLPHWSQQSLFIPLLLILVFGNYLAAKIWTLKTADLTINSFITLCFYARIVKNVRMQLIEDLHGVAHLFFIIIFVDRFSLFLFILPVIPYSLDLSMNIFSFHMQSFFFCFFFCPALFS